MPAFKLKAPRQFGDMPEGYEFQVASCTTSWEPNADEVEKEIIRLGFNREAQSFRSAGNFIVTKL